MLGHDPDQLLVAGLLGVPAQDGLGLGGVAPEVVHIRGTEPGGIDTDQHLAGLGVVAFLIQAGALPAEGDAVGGKSLLGEIADGVLDAGGDNEILGFVLLHDQPHALDVVLGIAPVTEGVHIAQFQVILQALGDAAGGQGNLTGDEVLASALRLVVE